MWSSNDSYLSLDFWVVSLPPYFINYIFIIYLSLALTSCRASLISFCGDEEQKEIKKTVCLTRMRACTYFIWVIWILNHHMYFAKISTSSHPHVWLLTWLCISVSCLTVWCLTLFTLISDQTPVRSVRGERCIPQYTVWRHHLHHSVFYCIFVLQRGPRCARCIYEVIY